MMDWSRIINWKTLAGLFILYGSVSEWLEINNQVRAGKADARLINSIMPIALFFIAIGAFLVYKGVRKEPLWNSNKSNRL